MARAVKKIGFFLGGAWISEGEAVEVRAPYDHSLVGITYQADGEHLEKAIAGALWAFERTRKLASYERQRILEQSSQAIALRKEEFALILAQEAGKPIRTARAEVDRAIFTLKVAAEESVRIPGEALPMDLQESTRGWWGIVRRFPIGPIAAITPFNFPLNLVCHKIAPAIAAGCPVVLKPAPQTPLSALMLAEVIQQAGWPDGGLSVLPLTNEAAGALVSDDRLKMLSFTGSAAVGWELKSRSGKKRVILELGGNAGVIVHHDFDIGYAAARCAMGGFSYAGQSCISVQRILVQRSVLESFIEVFVPRVQKLNSGDPLDEATDVGPMIRERDAVRAEEWVREAISGGAKALCGGKRHGSLFEPTVLTGTRPEMRVNCEEVFAPIVTVEAYDEFDSAIRLLNASRYGLQAGIFTRDTQLLFHAYEELQVGGVIAGDVSSFRIDHMPYGGTKDSGLGREGLRYAIEEMTELKILAMAPPPPPAR